MNFLGLGWNELAVIVLLAAIVLGPERITKFARQAGKFVRNVKAYFSSLTDELKTEMELLDELEEVKRDLTKKIK